MLQYPQKAIAALQLTNLVVVEVLLVILMVELQVNIGAQECLKTGHGVWVYHEALLEQGPCFEECPMGAGPCCYVCELQRGGPSALSSSCVLGQVYRNLQYPKP